MTGTEAPIRRGDRVRHRDGVEGVAMTDASAGLFVARAAGIGLVEWWASDVEALPGDAPPTTAALIARARARALLAESRRLGDEHREIVAALCGELARARVLRGGESAADGP